MSLSGRAAAKIVDPVSALYRKFREGNVPNTSMSCWTRVVNNEYTHTVGVATLLHLHTPIQAENLRGFSASENHRFKGEFHIFWTKSQILWKISIRFNVVYVY